MTVHTLTPPPATESAPAPTPILADDATDRARPDLAQPVDSLIAPVLAALARQDAACSERVVALLRDLADRGLLDAGVDAVMADAHGYAPSVRGSGSADGDATQDRQDQVAGARRGADHDPVRVVTAIIAAVADVCGSSATAVAVQRAAIEILARARRTPANERLLKALRRGSVVAALPAPGQQPLDGTLLVDGSILVAAGRVDVIGARPGGAILLQVRQGAAVVWAWTTYAAAGLTHHRAGGAAAGPERADARGGDATSSSTTLTLDRLVLRADTIIDPPTARDGAPAGPELVVAELLGQPQAA